MSFDLGKFFKQVGKFFKQEWHYLIHGEYPDRVHLEYEKPVHEAVDLFKEKVVEPATKGDPELPVLKPTSAPAKKSPLKTPKKPVKPKAPKKKALLPAEQVVAAVEKVAKKKVAGVKKAVSKSKASVKRGTK